MFFKRKLNLVVICLVLTGLLAACGENNETTPASNTSRSAQPASQATAPDLQSNSAIVGGPATVSNANSNTADPNRIERALPEATNRAFKYASLEFKVTSGLITNQLFTNPPTYSSEQAQLKLDLSISNPTKEIVRVDAGLFQLKLGDGTLFTQPVDLNLQPLDTKSYELIFNVPLATKWAGAQLELNEKDKEPVFLALEGSQASSPYPISLKAGTEVNVKDPKVTYKLTKASLELDAQGERVKKGHAYLVLSMLASNHDSKYEAYVGEDNFRLTIDGGNPQSPEKTDPVAQGVKELGSQEFSLAFTIPQNAKQLSLEVGEVGKGTAKIPLDMSTDSSATTPISTTKPSSPTK